MSLMRPYFPILIRYDVLKVKSDNKHAMNQKIKKRKKTKVIKFSLSTTELINNII